MKRYCVCPVIGSGTAADSYRAAVADVCPTTAKIKSHPVTGLPVFGDGNNDGAGNATDETPFLAEWGTADQRFDYNADGTVNLEDYEQFTNRYGTSL